MRPERAAQCAARRDAVGHDRAHGTATSPAHASLTFSVLQVTRTMRAHRCRQSTRTNDATAASPRITHARKRVAAAE